MEEWYEDGMSLDGYLDTGLDNFSTGRYEFWKENHLLELMEAVGDVAIDALDDLTVPSGHREAERLFLDRPRLDELADLLEKVGVRNLLVEHLEIEVARRFSLGTRGKAERALDLSLMIMNGAPGPRTLSFLRRLSRCYIAGFDSECVILCRAVMENALLAAYDRKGLTLREYGGGEGTIKRRIDFASTAGILSNEGARNAHTIRIRGNKAVHDDPEVTTDVRGTIAMTMDVLAELIPPT